MQYEPSTQGRVYNWRPDLPKHDDDYFYSGFRSPVVSLPDVKSLESEMTPVENQGTLGSCTAHSAVGAVEFLKKKATGQLVRYSRLFQYYNERKSDGDINFDAGSTLRQAVQTLAQYGICPEAEWPYVEAMYRVDPPQIAYQDALTFKALKFSRVNQNEQEVVSVIAEGFPIMFGFTVYKSFESEQVARTGIMVMPGFSVTDPCMGGHAVLAVGYDRKEKCILVRNSWGASWGLNGYFKMPYDYFFNTNLADDLWVVEGMTGL